MKNKVIFAITFIILVVANIFLINEYAKAQGTNINIEVLIEGKDEVPKTGRIGDPGKLSEDTEMWHYSGK